MRIPYWKRGLSPPARESRTMKWLLKSPSALHVSVTGARSAPHGNPVDFFNLVAAEDPGEGKVKGSRPDDQASKNEKLHQEARVQRKPSVVIPEPASHSHDAGTKGNF